MTHRDIMWMYFNSLFDFRRYNISVRIKRFDLFYECGVPFYFDIFKLLFLELRYHCFEQFDCYLLNLFLGVGIEL